MKPKAKSLFHRHKILCSGIFDLSWSDGDECGTLYLRIRSNGQYKGILVGFRRYSPARGNRGWKLHANSLEKRALLRCVTGLWKCLQQMSLLGQDNPHAH